MTTETDLLRRAAERLSYASDVEARDISAALLALADSLEGKVLVPREPTDAMVVAAHYGNRKRIGCNYVGVYRAMLAAARAEIASLREQLEVARKDAERYRWLRDNACCRSSDGDDGPVLVCVDDDEDAAIDAAMEADK